MMRTPRDGCVLVPALAAMLLLLTTGNAAAQPLTTAFTYQGELIDAGSPASGLHDLRFRLYDAAVAGAQIGPALCADDVMVDALGRFTVELDFGSVYPGASRYLEIQVRTDTGVGCEDTRGFIVLTPRTNLTATPYASHALSAGTASNASLLNGQPAAFYTNAGNLSSGTLADTRLSANVSTLAGVQTFSGMKTFIAAPFFSAGGAPFTVTSSTRVPNLNADLLDGLHSSAFSLLGHVHDASAITSGTLADARLGTNVTLLSGSQTFTGTKTFLSPPVFSAGGAPFAVSSTTHVANLNADLLDGQDSAAFSLVGHQHNASAISSGTLSDARLSTNVARRNADNLFSGTQVFQNPAGFGTASPLAEVHVANAAGNADILIKRNDAAQGFNLGVSLTPILFISRSDGTAFTDILMINGSTDRVGIGTSAPEARLDIRGAAGDDPFRVRVDGSTKFRLYANGGTAIGSNPASVPANGLYVQGSVGVGTLSPASPLHAVSESDSGAVVTGESTAESGATVGVYGKTSSGSGVAVNGETFGTFGTPTGVRGLATGLGGRGVVGIASATSGVNFGVFATVSSSSGTGVRAASEATTGQTYGVRATAASPDGFGVQSINTSSTGDGVGVRGESVSTSGRGVVGRANSSSGINFGVWGEGSSAAGFDFYAAGAGLNYGSASSRRWKSDIQNIDAPLDKLSRLRGVYYTWDVEHGGHRDVGFIAEEVGAVLPEIVRFEANGVDAIGMDYSMMAPLLVEAVNALRIQNEHLRKSNSELEDRLEQIEKRLRELGLLDEGKEPRP